MVDHGVVQCPVKGQVITRLWYWHAVCSYGKADFTSLLRIGGKLWQSSLLIALSTAIRLRYATGGSGAANLERVYVPRVMMPLSCMSLEGKPRRRSWQASSSGDKSNSERHAALIVIVWSVMSTSR